MGKEIATRVQEAQSVPYRINPRRNMPRHIVIKLAKIKDKKDFKKKGKKQENYPSITYKYECKNLSQNTSNMKPTEL